MMENKKCAICGKEITGEYFQASVDKNLKLTDKGNIVCSMECAKKYEKTLPHEGKAVEHYSRITGYYQNITGWNEGKTRELKDRKRYSLLVR